jgi:hypothetical protein
MALHAVLKLDAYALIVLSDQRRTGGRNLRRMRSEDSRSQLTSRGATLDSAKVVATRIYAPGSASIRTAKIARTTGCGKTIDVVSPE